MKRARIFHNPSAGKTGHTRQELVSLVKSHGYDCQYTSTSKKGWKKKARKIDFLVIAGGDGTVRKVAVKALDNKLSDNPPILLFPLGTANNIARSLGIEGEPADIIKNLGNCNRRSFDAGRIRGVGRKSLFIESFGFGVFPRLMKEIKGDESREKGSAEDEIRFARDLLHDIILKYPASEYHIEIDGMEYSGKYLLTEIMNIASIGPNLVLSPGADPGDGEFEVIVVPESQREEFAGFVANNVAGAEQPFSPMTLRGKNIMIKTPVTELHIDDELVDAKKAVKVRIKPEHAMMEFLIQ